MVVSGGDSPVDFEMPEHTLDPIALAVELLVISDRCGAVGLGRDDRFDPAILQIAADCVAVISLIGQQSVRLLLGQIDQRVVAFAVRRLARCEIEGEGSASGITDTMNFTGKPAPRAAKSSLMNPPFPPAAET